MNINIFLLILFAVSLAARAEPAAPDPKRLAHSNSLARGGAANYSSGE